MVNCLNNAFYFYYRCYVIIKYIFKVLIYDPNIETYREKFTKQVTPLNYQSFIPWNCTHSLQGSLPTSLYKSLQTLEVLFKSKFIVHHHIDKNIPRNSFNRDFVPVLLSLKSVKDCLSCLFLSSRYLIVKGLRYFKSWWNCLRFNMITTFHHKSQNSFADYHDWGRMYCLTFQNLDRSLSLGLNHHHIFLRLRNAT